jgi:hypothetical protein
MIFLQNLSDRMLSFLWQVGSQDIFAKKGSPRATLPAAGGDPRYFCKNLTDCLLPFLWQQGAKIFLQKPDSPYVTLLVAGGEP